MKGKHDKINTISFEWKYESLKDIKILKYIQYNTYRFESKYYNSLRKHGSFVHKFWKFTCSTLLLCNSTGVKPKTKTNTKHTSEYFIS